MTNEEMGGPTGSNRAADDNEEKDHLLQKADCMKRMKFYALLFGI
jgi:hypothetical protein